MVNNISQIVLSLVALLFVSCSDSNDYSDVYIAPAEKEEEQQQEEEEALVVTLSALHVDGRYLKNAEGEVVNLHGFAQTFSPYFNESAWSNYNVDACLSYNKDKIDKILSVAGWQMTFVRQHMDPYWCAKGYSSEKETHEYFNLDDFKTYFNSVYLPMAEYATSKGLYVVMRPPGVCPETIAVDDDYNKYLIEVWDYVSKQSRIKSNPGIMFELANEPIHIVGTDGSVGGDKEPQFEALSQFLQPVVDAIRANGATNVIWLPGLGYQSWYSGFARYPVTGDNIGMAVHCYPGWYGSDALADSGEGLYDGTNGGYASFQAGWDSRMGDTPDQYPIMITEMDWSNGNIYYSTSSSGSTSNWTWGQGLTGTAGGSGFGANLHYITDNMGNASYMIFTGQEYLANFIDVPSTTGVYTFYNDPENSCLWPTYHWYQEYAGVPNTAKGTLTGIYAYIDGTICRDGDTYSLPVGKTAYAVLHAEYSNDVADAVSTAAGYTITNSDSSVLRLDNMNKLSAIGSGSSTLTISYEGYTLNVTITTN